MLKGFYCPQDKEPSEFPDFKKCLECKSQCLPITVIDALFNERNLEPGVYHATELTKPIRIIYLQRTHDYYTTINGVINTTIGTAYHDFLLSRRDKYKGKFVFEPDTSFEVSIGGLKLTGTPDLYDVENKTIYDYKIIKLYEAERMLKGQGLDDYIHQLNIYKTYKFPEAKKLILIPVIKDFTANSVYTSPIQTPIFKLPIPILPTESVKRFVENRIKLLDDVINERVPCPKCTDEETWGEKRCLNYCDVASQCGYKKSNNNNNKKEKENERSKKLKTIKTTKSN